ncbi:DUF421 domain-containing protein [Loktanella sp. DJP18]|uniref:DUF421 domain-containing protein n=1 Tax=Loktanella sp. DJP18 TaxID=3409788 RepID=UPI003BB51E3C
MGSAVGDALFYPDVPLLHAMLVITLVIVADKGLDALILRFRWAKIAVDGLAKVVVRDGMILQDGLGRRTTGAAELRARLRVDGIANLGEVASAFLEPGGRLSVSRHETPRPGLRIIPLREIGGMNSAVTGVPCCTECGYVDAGGQNPKVGRCPNCGGDRWTEAENPQDAAGHSVSLLAAR